MWMSYSVSVRDAAKAIGGLAGIASRSDNLRRPLDRTGQYLVRKTVRILRSGERGIQARHASGLAGAFTYATFFGAEVYIGANKAQAAIQNVGGLVKSSRPGGYLSIPVADNLKGNGDPRWVSPRLVPDGFFFRSVVTGALLFGRLLNRRVAKRRQTYQGRARASLNRYRQESAAIELLFVLKSEVVIPEHRYCTFDPSDQAATDGYFADWILRGR